ncbi:hypothetical protein UlMin_023633 [Ulmus minor]
MKKCSSSVVQIQKGDKFSLMQCPKNELERKQMDGVPYASTFGSLMYAQTCTRPDINFSIGMLGTKDHMPTYRRSSHLEVIRYSDSDYIGCVDTRKSTFAYLFLLAGGAISWKSAKQSVIIASTMEAEFVACFEATIQGNWLQNFISRLGIVDTIARLLKVYCDNSSAIFFTKNNKY